MGKILVGLHGCEINKNRFMLEFPLTKMCCWDKELLLENGFELMEEMTEKNLLFVPEVIFVDELLPGDIDPDERECYFLWIRDEPIGLCDKEMLKYDVTLNIKNIEKLEKIKNILIK